MTKIIAALDGLKFSESTRDYAIQIAQQTKAHLVGIFLDDFTYSSYRVYDLIYEKGGLAGSGKRKLDKKDSKKRATAVMNFEKACKQAGVDYTIHRDRSVAIQEILHETIYADLLIIDKSETLSRYPEKIPSEFLRDLLSQSQCPVLVVPSVFKPVQKLVLLYDGAPASVHAIKMFSYILDAMKQHPAEIVSVNAGKYTPKVPDIRLMTEFMTRHFPKATYTVLKGMPESLIVDYLKKQKDLPLVVLGAYCRGKVSRWFRTSMADILMKELKLPLFIAPNR